jgi:Skp family chaperone for outer membrane proteins
MPSWQTFFTHFSHQLGNLKNFIEMHGMLPPRCVGKVTYMRKIFVSLAAVGTLLTTACGAHGGGISGVLTIDMARTYNSYGQAERSKEQFQKAVEKAQDEMRVMLDEGIKMAKDLQDIREKMDNPALSESARSKFQQQVEEKSELVRKKEAEVNTFRQQTDRELMERREEFVAKHIEAIRAAVAKVAATRKVQLVLNTSGIEVLYADGALDVTDEVIQILNDKK